MTFSTSYKPHLNMASFCLVLTLNNAKLPWSSKSKQSHGAWTKVSLKIPYLAFQDYLYNYRSPVKFWEGNVLGGSPRDYYSWCIGPHCTGTPPTPPAPPPQTSGMDPRPSPVLVTSSGHLFKLVYLRTPSAPITGTDIGRPSAYSW